MTCQFKTHNECFCQGRCQQVLPKTAPVVRITWRDHIAFIVFGAVVSLVAYGTMVAWEKQEARIELERRV